LDYSLWIASKNRGSLLQCNTKHLRHFVQNYLFLANLFGLTVSHSLSELTLMHGFLKHYSMTEDLKMGACPVFEANNEVRSLSDRPMLEENYLFSSHRSNSAEQQTATVENVSHTFLVEQSCKTLPLRQHINRQILRCLTTHLPCSRYLRNLQTASEYRCRVTVEITAKTADPADLLVSRVVFSDPPPMAYDQYGYEIFSTYLYGP
jgi:hypothetical protein